MSLAALSMFLNVVIVILLGVTIYYAIRLTKSLNDFRNSRQDFNGIMRELTRNIDEAQRGIENLRGASKEAGQNLQKIINDSRRMAQELQAINQASTTLLDSTGLIEDVLDDPESFQMAGEAEEDEDFSIYDAEFAAKPAQKPKPAEEPSVSFQSRAERDLYEAIQKNRKLSGRGAA